MPHVKLSVEREMPVELRPFDVVMLPNASLYVSSDEQLRRYVNEGGGLLGFVDALDDSLPAIFGAQPSGVGPPSELRVILENAEHPLAERLPHAIYVKGRYQSLAATTNAIEVLLYADWRYQHSPVLVLRHDGGGKAACTTLQAYDNPGLQRILYRTVRWLANQSSGKRSLGVGILGYSPFIGQAHGEGVEATKGLNLRAVCDLNWQRLKQAMQDFPGARTYLTVEELANDPAVDLVIMATPPNTHAQLAVQMMNLGKHVVCEKPLALTQQETHRMAETAERLKVHLSCHQNRRWDVDYLAVKRAVDEGLIGEIFYIETFVGGFAHPCGYWHSHDGISGGTTYDWGGHYLDWIVSLVPEPIRWVTCTRHNRVWHDVTNADHERIQIRFEGGREAEFLHSDIAALRKPKWYVLGTEGAIVGNWRDTTVFEIDPVAYFHEHAIPATEMPPDLTLVRRHGCGELAQQKLPMPAREQHLFHHNVADHLITGEPLTAPLNDSIRVVEILEAAVRSAAKGGSMEAAGG